MALASIDGGIGEGRTVRRQRLEGALLGVVLTAMVATVGTALGASWSIGFLDLSLVAMAVAAYVGWTGAPQCIAAKRAAWAALKQAVRASAGGVFVFAVIAFGAGLVTAMLDDPSPAGGGEGVMPLVLVAYLLLVSTYGFVFSLPLTIPIAFVATAVLRLGDRHPGVPIGVIVAGAMLALIGSVAGADLLKPLRGDGLSPAGGVVLEWTVVNHSSFGGEIAVNDPDPASRSVGGWTRPLAPCSITSDRTREAADWFISLEVGPDTAALDFMGPDPSPLVSAADAPGDHATIWIEVAPDGGTSVWRGVTARPAGSADAGCDLP